ncbi:MAG: HAD family hydrolase [Selenomonadaceae bacterium]|jgi:HAD superfamily hydrolase (TIGR01509 family)
MKAVIFDMDGVIIDSEPMHTKVVLDVLSSYQVHLTPADLDRFAGMTMHSVNSALKTDYDIQAPLEEIIACEIKGMIRHTLEDPQQPIDGIREILTYLEKNRIPAAVASSSPRELVQAVVSRLELDDYFQFLLSGENVTQSKPHPEIYLQAAARLNIAPADCLVIEDSKNGTIAAKEAGMTCIGFQNLNSGLQDLSRADIIVDTLTAIDLSQF